MLYSNSNGVYMPVYVPMFQQGAFRGYEPEFTGTVNVRYPVR